MLFRPTTEKKTILSRFGKVEVSNDHPLGLSIKKFRISPFMQDLMIFAGQNSVYEDAAAQLEKFLQTEVQSKQIERLVHHYGPQVANAYENFHSNRKQAKEDLELAYVMIDGGMILTREEKWKEVKLGRVFRPSSLLQQSDSRRWLRESDYVAHLGKIEPFLKNMGTIVDKLFKPVFINDGAPWIWCWIDQYYPDSIQILDYYHAAEYLWSFAREHFKDEKKMKQWAERQKELLLKDRVDEVIKNVERRKVTRPVEREQKKKLIRYYTANIERMYYGTFRADGLMIGSGPIESAHRTVIQERLKRSGQRWTTSGAQALIPLRVVQKSRKWGLVIDLIKKNAA